MKPPFRRGKGTPSVGGDKCPCCRTGMPKKKNRRIIRHREEPLIRKVIYEA